MYFLASYALPCFLFLCHEDGGKTQFLFVLGHIVANVQAVCCSRVTRKKVSEEVEAAEHFVYNVYFEIRVQFFFFNEDSDAVIAALLSSF